MRPGGEWRWEWSEAEKALSKALYEWQHCRTVRDTLLNVAGHLFDTRKCLKRYAMDVNEYAPELNERYKAVRRELFEIATELKKKGLATELKPFKMEMADDPTKEE